MDVFYIEAVMAEIAPHITGAVFKKIHQPDADSMIFRLWNGRRELRLRIDLAVGGTGIYLTERAWINPPNPMRFCQLLRARLARLTDLRQVPAERIVVFTCAGCDKTTYHLVAELYGRRPNLILCHEDWTIVDLLHRREGAAGLQDYLPGAVWSPPPKVAGISLERAAHCWDPTNVGGLPAEWLRRNVRPMSPAMARQLAAMMEQGGDPLAVLQDFVRRWQDRDYVYQIGVQEGSPRLLVYPPAGIEFDDIREFPSASTAADTWFSAYASAGRGEERTVLIHTVQRAMTKLERRLERLRKEKEASGAADDLQFLGEVLTANLHRVRKGMTEIEVENYYAPGSMVKIPLDPAATPAENAERFFKRSKKVRRGRTHVERRLDESGAEKQWLEALLMDLSAAETGEDLEGVAEEMRAYGMLPARHRKPLRRAKAGHAGIREALTPGGFVVQWGTNNRANDYLVKHLCRPGDLWFHSLGTPGCHLILKVSSRKDMPPEEDILYAASLAAGHSRAAGEGRTEVMVAEGRQVHKPKGALPGLVQVKSYRTLQVAPRHAP